MILESLAFYMLQAATGGDIRPARTFNPYALCSCVKKEEGERVEFTGVASDAQLVLGADGRSAEARQATIFRVLKGADDSETAKVWHVTDPAKCGVKFDYGKRYDVVALKKADGALETSYCVMPRAAK